MEYTEVSMEVLTSLKGASVRMHGEWTFVTLKGKTYGYKGTISELKEHQGAFELTVTVDEKGHEYGHIHLADLL